MLFRSDGSEIRCTVEAGHESQLTRDTVTAAVHFIEFRFTPEQVESFVEGTQLVIDHPDYLEVVELAARELLLGTKAAQLLDYAAQLKCDALFISDIDSYESLDDAALREKKIV